MNDPENLKKAATALRESDLVDVATRKPEITQVLAAWLEDAALFEPGPGVVNYNMRAFDFADLILAEYSDE